jgi:hypothetical protein
MADQTNDTIAKLLRRVTEGQESILELSKEGEVTKVAFGSRKLQPELPVMIRSESPPRAHVFHTPGSLVDYVTMYGNDKTVILLDVPAMKGAVVLDETNFDQFECLPFEPVKHPLFSEWAAMLGKRLDVLQFAEFVMGHRRQVVQPDGREVAMIFSQLQASTKMTVARGQGKQALNGVMVETTIQGKKGEAFVELPESITIRLPLFVGEPESEIEIDLLVGAEGDRLWVSASASGVLAAQFVAFERMADAIKSGCESATVGLGRVSHGKWDYLRA